MEKTIIIGGGIAGMSCALRFLEEKQDFLLITPNLGGRIKYSEQYRVNYGAYFVMSSYTNARRLVSRGSWINPADACFHNSPVKRFKLVSLNTLQCLPELLHFAWQLSKFSVHYAAFKQRCLHMPLKQALQVDDYMDALFLMPAGEFIRLQKFPRAASDYVAKFAYACTGATPEQLNALDFMNVSMGMLIPINRLVFDLAAMEKRFEGHLLMDTVSSLERQSDHFNLGLGSGKNLQAGNVVAATPAHITRELLGLPEIREACSFHVFHIRAVLKPLYRGSSLNLFPAGSDLMLISREFDGTYLVYGLKMDTDLGQIAESWEVITMVDWEHAMYVYGKSLMEQQAGEGLFIAGDHNGLGLEPAAISGIYAANQVMKRSKKQ